MEYLSFDVGIKNLAYCCLNENKTIKQWGIINMNTYPVCDVKLRKKCEKQATYEVKDDPKVKYCCTAHSKKFKKKKKLNSNHDILKLSQTSISELKELDITNVKYVLIENQPALKNPVMKSVQMIIYTYFVMEGVMNDKSSIETIHMVNARNKLKVYKGPKIECNKKDKYAQNKFLSIAYTEKMINEEEECYKELFDKSKKKDDLADAYLQGIYWIEKK